MPPSISSYILSPETEQDLNDVFDYTEGVYGFDQAVSYLSEFDDIFHQLIDNPELGRIRIVRILHGSCDLQRHNILIVLIKDITPTEYRPVA